MKNASTIQASTIQASTKIAPTKMAPTKKLATLGLLLAMGLAACGGSDPAPASSPAAPAAQAAPAVAAPAVAPAAASPTTAAQSNAPAAGYGTPTTVAAGTPTTAAPAAAAKQPSLVSVAASDLGQILADAEGMTLYGFTDDANGQPTCVAACAKAWPPLTVAGSFDVSTLPASGAFSIVARADGTSQLKSGKWPLYYFAGDGAEGETNGQASGGKWFVVGADGVLVK